VQEFSGESDEDAISLAAQAAEGGAQGYELWDKARDGSARRAGTGRKVTLGPR
jgi:hypothetical protein